MLEIEMNDFVLLKIMENLILDFPVQPKAHFPVHKDDQNIKHTEASLTLNFDGAKININVKKDLTEIKLGQVDGS